MQFFRTRATGLCVAALLAAPGMAAAQSDGGDSAKKGDPNPVVAVVNGDEIRFQQVKKSAQDLPAQYQKQFKRLFPALLDRVVDTRLLGKKAEDAGLAGDPEVAERVAEAKKQIMSQVYLERARDERMTESRLKSAYNDYRKKNPPRDEVRARHILVEKEAKAEEVIAKLDEGTAFKDLASEYSTGPSGQRGGDLGYFSKDKMVKPFANAAFDLEAGNYTSEPVKTQFGWHVIKVEDKRRKEPKSFAEMKPELRQQLQREVTQEVLKNVRKGEAVKTFPERAPGVKAEQGQMKGQGQMQGQGSGNAQ